MVVVIFIAANVQIIIHFYISLYSLLDLMFPCVVDQIFFATYDYCALYAHGADQWYG